MHPLISDFVRDVAIATRFLGRMPISARFAPHDPPDFAKMAYAVPVAGLIVAIPVALVAVISHALGLPPTISATLALVVGLLATGALHEDGLADICDGFGGGGDRETKLEIMRDSRIGTYGTLGLLASTWLRILLLAEIMVLISPIALFLVILASATVSRGALVWLWARLPPARDDGLSLRFGTPQDDQFFKALMAIGVALLPALFFATGLVPLLAAIIVVAGPIWLFARFSTQQIGGHTGDVLGAGQVIAEICFLLGLLITI